MCGLFKVQGPYDYTGHMSMVLALLLLSFTISFTKPETVGPPTT